MKIYDFVCAINCTLKLTCMCAYMCLCDCMCPREQCLKAIKISVR